MDLNDILTPGNVAVGVRIDGAREAQAALVDLLPDGGRGLRGQILDSVRKREALQSTGIGHAIAIPHAVAAIEEPLLASVLVSANPVDYAAVDREPVRIFILLVSREDLDGAHLRALAQVSRLLSRSEFREALIAAESPEEVLDLLAGRRTP